MPFEMHTIEMLDGSNQNRPDRVLVGLQTGVANLVGGAAGAAVTTGVTFGMELPTAYAVFVTVDNTTAAAVQVAAKTNTGFNVILTPVVATATIAVGTFDVMVVA